MTDLIKIRTDHDRLIEYGPALVPGESAMFIGITTDEWSRKAVGHSPSNGNVGAGLSESEAYAIADWVYANITRPPTLPSEHGLYQLTDENENQDATIEHARTFRHTHMGWVDALHNEPLSERATAELAAAYRAGRLFRLIRQQVTA